MKTFFLNLLKGIAMGSANVIPGVSGGTIALITGIFERLINSIKSFNATALRLLFKGDFKAFAKHTDIGFLLTIGMGIVVAIFSVAKLFEYLFDEHPVMIWSFFFGLLLASIYFVGVTVKRWNISSIVSFAIGAAIALFIAFTTPATENQNFIYLMICGAVGTCSMILPGLSGSYVLLLLGNYELIMIDSINNLATAPLESMKILLPVVLGGVAGILAFSHLLSWIFKKHHDATVSLLTGFIIGSMPIIWPWKNAITKTLKDGTEKIIGYDWLWPEFDMQFIIAIAIMLIGAAIIIITEVLAKKLNK